MLFEKYDGVYEGFDVVKLTEVTELNWHRFSPISILLLHHAHHAHHHRDQT